MRLDDACDLYSVLGKYLPKDLPDETMNSYTTRVLDELMQHSQDFKQAWKLLTRLSEENLETMEIDEIKKWWMEGMAESKILLMKDYLEGITDGR